MTYSKKPLLSILICTMPVRNQAFQLLLDNLKKQISNGFDHEVEVISDDRMEITTGFKRNDLLSKSKAKFSVFIDDDDIVSNDYVSKILNCIKENPDIDCIGIKGQIITNGSHIKQWEISKDFNRWYEDNDKYYRTPNHISPIKTKLCLQAGFPDITIGEDSEFSKRVLPLLKKEAKIDGNIYFYHYNNGQTNHPTNHPTNQEFPYRPAWR
jgi:glycosyltransferase involved in cell wall biosynthesis